MSMFLKVSAVRVDGGVQDTTFIGYAAESCAFALYNQLKDSNSITFVQIVERTEIGGKIDWDVRASKSGFAN